MARGRNISGNQDGCNGANDSYTIVGRGVVPRPQIVREIVQGMHPDTHVITVNGEQYARNNPNCNLPDNIDD